MFQFGLGVPKDIDQAIEFFQKSSDKGYALASVNLGYLFMVNPEIPENYEKAMKLFQSAIDKGYLDAHYGIGELYQKGLGVTKDLAKALAHSQIAAGLGLSLAKEQVKEIESELNNGL
jgi:TPR repeat protein